MTCGWSYNMGRIISSACLDCGHSLAVHTHQGGDSAACAICDLTTTHLRSIIAEEISRFLLERTEIRIVNKRLAVVIK